MRPRYPGEPGRGAICVGSGRASRGDRRELRVGQDHLADQVAERLGVLHVELDAHYHRAGWTPTPPEVFAEAVRGALDAADAAAGGWVVCGNYRPVRTSIWARADTIVWLDLPPRW